MKSYRGQQSDGPGATTGAIQATPGKRTLTGALDAGTAQPGRVVQLQPAGDAGADATVVGSGAGTGATASAGGDKTAGGAAAPATPVVRAGSI